MIETRRPSKQHRQPTATPPRNRPEDQVQHQGLGTARQSLSQEHSELPLQGSSPDAPLTPGMFTLGWILVIFGALPLVMAIHGEGRPYLLAAVIMLTTGLFLIGLSRRRRPAPPA